MPKRTSNPEYRRRRAEVLEGNPLCHWCKKAPATEADHVIPHDLVGDDTPIVASCKPCNAQRGAIYLAQKKAHVQHQRNEALGLQDGNKTPKPKSPENFLKKENSKPPSPSLLLSETNQTSSGGFSLAETDSPEFGRVQPRLETPITESASYGDLVAGWSERVLNKTLFGWQRQALNGQLTHDDNGDLVHRESLVSTARQNGKSVALTALIGWWLTDFAAMRGKPMKVLSTANKLDRAVAIFNELAPVLEAHYDAKVTWSYGRNKVEIGNCVWEVRAATPHLHGGTYDLIIVDEVWNVTEEVYFDALRPSQIAVKSPLLSSWSTSGDEGSKTMQRLREQALGAIDKHKQTRLYFAEWSLPDVDPNDTAYWRWANPALGETITLDALHAAAESPDRAAFLRAHLNLWVSSADAWLQPGVWEKLKTEQECPAGGVLAVDCSVDSSKYVGIRCGLTEEQTIVATVEFSTESMKEMWLQIEKAMEADPKLRLVISPTLDVHTPEKLERRRTTFGYAEILKLTALTRSLILEHRVLHRGEELLASHVNRAVLARANGQVVISSQRSPGPIEAARLLVVAAAMVSRPINTNRPSMGSAK